MSNLIPGKGVCYATSYTMKIWVKDGKASKVLVPLMVDIGGTKTEHTEWMSVDPEDTTPKGKPRVEFTIENLTKLGATHAADDLADALDNAATEVTFRWEETPHWEPCEVRINGQYTNVYIGEGAKLDASKAKRAGDAIRKLSSKGASPAVNPFAPPPSRGTNITPPTPFAPPKAPAPSAPQPTEGDSIPF